jgi:hypothetical protein
MGKRIKDPRPLDEPLGPTFQRDLFAIAQLYEFIEDAEAAVLEGVTPGLARLQQMR